jgi:tetraacyldisaccharide 4'-kinase
VQLTSFFEAMYFAPKWYHYPLILLLSPLSLIYGVIMYLRRSFTAKKAYDIPIISVGNLIVGGSGKTPFTIALASEFENVTIISRGYGRKSKGLVEVSRRGKILTDVGQSGDEPMLMAASPANASVIVSEDRDKAIKLAQENGAELIILDDGFNRVEIEKFETLLEPETIKNCLPFPAGPFREFWFAKSAADIIVKEGKDFVREVSVEDPRSKMLLVTAISNPERLERYLPQGVIKKIYLPDHAYFDEGEIKQWMDECGAESILCTSKDRVKMKGFDLPISELKLKLNIEDDIIKKIQKYIQRSN